MKTMQAPQAFVNELLNREVVYVCIGGVKARRGEAGGEGMEGWEGKDWAGRKGNAGGGEKVCVSLLVCRSVCLYLCLCLCLSMSM